MRGLKAVAVLLAVFVIIPRYAQADIRTYVSSSGSDANDCTFAMPCASFSGALAKTGIDGEINCLTPGSYTFPVLVIQKSITIDCSNTIGGVVYGLSGNTTITINIPVASNDPTRTVRLRGLSLSGIGFLGPNLNSTGTRVTDKGIDIISAAAVFIEKSVISDFTQQGIYDHRTGGQTKLFIADSTIRNNGGAGIVAAAAATGIVVLDNVRSENNSYGIAVGTGNNVVINRSVFSGNSIAGVEGDNGAQIAVNNSTISHNNNGVQSTSSVRLSNNDIAFNSFAFSGVAGTFGNNRLSGNSAIGTAPTPLGGATSDLGQQ